MRRRATHPAFLLRTAVHWPQIPALRQRFSAGSAFLTPWGPKHEHDYSFKMQGSRVVLSWFSIQRVATGIKGFMSVHDYVRLWSCLTCLFETTHKKCFWGLLVCHKSLMTQSLMLQSESKSPWMIHHHHSMREDLESILKLAQTFPESESIWSAKPRQGSKKTVPALHKWWPWFHCFQAHVDNSTLCSGFEDCRKQNHAASCILHTIHWMQKSRG